MADDKKDPGLADLSGDALLAELDDWDKMFDSLHEADEEAIQQALPPDPPAAAEPEPPAEDPPPALPSEPPPGFHAQGVEPPDAAGIHEDPGEAGDFGLGPAGGVVPPKPPGRRNLARDFASESPFEERKDDAEPPLDELLSAVASTIDDRAEALSGPLPNAPTEEELVTSARKPSQPDLSEVALGAMDADKVAEAEMSSDALSKMSETAEAFFADNEPGLELSLDDDFYDGIEIGAEPVHEPESDRSFAESAGDRLLAHTVRRPDAEQAEEEFRSAVDATTAVRDTPAELEFEMTGGATTAVREPPRGLLDAGEAEPHDLEKSETTAVREPPQDVIERASRAETREPAEATRAAVAADQPSRGDSVEIDVADDLIFDESPASEDSIADGIPVQPLATGDSTEITAVADEPGLEAAATARTSRRPSSGLLERPDTAEEADSEDFELELDGAIDNLLEGADGARSDDSAMDGVVEAALDDAVSLSNGTLLTGPALQELDVPPDLPPGVFDDHSPHLRPRQIEVPDQVEPDDADRTDEIAAELVLYERELGLLDEPGPSARLRLEAGRLAERIGDLDRARAHHDAALGIDPRLAPAARALRRIERTLGHWDEVANQIDHESERAAPTEKRGLAAYRADVLMAAGESDLARVVVGELLDQAPTDVRALLAMIELAMVDGRWSEVEQCMQRLAEGLADDSLRATLDACSGHVALDDGRSAADSFARAAERAPRDVVHLLRAALGASVGQSAAYARAAEAAVDSAPELAPALAWWAWRTAGEDEENERLQQALAIAPDQPLLLERAIALAVHAGDVNTAADLLARLGECAPTPGERADALRRHASLSEGEGAIASLRAALAADPSDRAAALELLSRVDAIGDSEAAVELYRSTGEHALGAMRLIDAGRAEAAAELLRGVSGWLGDALRLESTAGPEARAQLLAEQATTPAPHRQSAAALRTAAMAAEAAGDRDGAHGLWSRCHGEDPLLAGSMHALWRLARDQSELQEVLGGVLAGSCEPLRAAALAQRFHLELESGGTAAALDSVGSEGDHLAAHLRFAALGREGRWSEAAEALQNAPAGRLGTEANRYRAAVLFADAADDGDRAAAVLEPLIASQPEFGAARDLQARIGGQTSGAGAAEVLPPGATELDEYSAMLREAERLEQAGDGHAAYRAYHRALEKQPEDPVAESGLQRAARVCGESALVAERALAGLRQAEEVGDARTKADAYEELARIDEEIRGDTDSALLSWISAAEVAPDRLHVARVLEARLDRRARAETLVDVNLNLANALGEAEASTYLLEAGQLMQVAGGGRDDMRDCYQRALAIDPHARAALLFLEADARRGPASARQAELEEQTARYFDNDPRAHAAFLVRAGETLVALGDLDAAIERFRSANQVRPGFAPALSAWLETAIRSERWPEAASAATAEADAAATDERRAERHHLAAVILMDRARDGEAAVEACKRVLAIDPAHRDAFVRLRLLLSHLERDDDLMQVLSSRLEVETDPDAIVELRFALSDLYRDYLGDSERAIVELREVLKLRPGDPLATVGVSHLAWELGLWDEAAESLISRAKVERDKTVQKEIFLKLGTIYSEHLPDSKYAFKSFQRVLSLDPTDVDALEKVSELAIKTGDWRMALGACEQLIKLEPPQEDKVRHLHRVAQIYDEGVGDKARAERALRVAVDVAPESEAALNKLIGFYRKAGDTRSMRIHLDRSIGAARSRLQSDVLQPEAYRLIAQTLAARAEAGVQGSLTAARFAAELARLTHADTTGLEPLLETPPSKPPLGGLVEEFNEELLFPRAVPNAARAIFRILGERLAKHIGIDVRRHGVGRGERLRKGSDPIAALALEIAAELGIDDVDSYVGGSNPRLIAAEATSPVSLIFGSEVASAQRPGELRFWVARQLVLLRSNMWPALQLGEERFGVLLAALLRQFSPEFAPPGLDPAHIQTEQQKMKRLIPSSMNLELGPYAMALAGSEFDHRALHAAAIAAGNRAGLIACDRLADATSALMRAGGYRDIHQASRTREFADLLRFAVSEDLVRLRAAVAP